jgi:protein-disulfide isomerase
MNEKTTSHAREDTIKIKRSHFYTILIFLAFGVGILVGYAWGSSGGSPVVAQAAPQADLQAMAPTPIPQRVDVPIEGYPSLGPVDAPITIVEFSDFQCPYCRKFHQETYQALLDAYPGQIRFVYRNLPLTSMHPEAFPSAVASLCAQDQNAFWPFYEKLFSSDELGRDAYLKYAADLELDVPSFETCLDSGRHDEFIQADSDYALSIGVNSTPTFFVNGVPVIGAYPLSYFKQVIDEELVKIQ